MVLFQIEKVLQQLSSVVITDMRQCLVSFSCCIHEPKGAFKGQVIKKAQFAELQHYSKRTERTKQKMETETKKDILIGL
jgi:hypothetical protein